MRATAPSSRRPRTDRLGPDDRGDGWERDLHDFFNLVALVPVVVLNALNWDWDALLLFALGDRDRTPEQAWAGDWFPPFFAITVGYFLADLIWVVLVPQCVKTPGIIVQHHLATLLYLIVPYNFPEDRWLMGACLSVEVNTWLLIARRVVYRQGRRPTNPFPVRTRLISVLFYATWFFIRCYVYPCILRLFLALWLARWEETGSAISSHYLPCLLLHSVFCLLNFKWTFDLLVGVLRSRGKPTEVERGL